MVTRYRRRRYRRSGRYNLSKFNLYRYKSSNARARQIYKVNKKLSKYVKRNQPKILPYEQYLIFNAAGAANHCFGSPTQALIPALFPNQELNQQFTFARLHNCKLTFMFTPDTIASQIVQNRDVVVTARVVVFQYRQAHSTIDASPWHIWNVTQADMQAQDYALRKGAELRCLYGPLRHGSSAKFKVLRDFRFSFNSRFNEVKAKTCKIKYLYNLKRAKDKTYPAGTLMWVAVWSSNVQDVPEANSKALRFNVIQKIAISTTLPSSMQNDSVIY